MLLSLVLVTFERRNCMAVPCESLLSLVRFPPGLFRPARPSAFTSLASMAAPAAAAAAVAAVAAPDPAAVAAAAVAAIGAGIDPGAARLQQLVADKKALAARKTANAKELRNEVKKQTRLKQKAKQLSTQDLLDLLAAKNAVPKAKAKAKAKAAPAPPPAPPPPPAGPGASR